MRFPFFPFSFYTYIYTYPSTHPTLCPTRNNLPTARTHIHAKMHLPFAFPKMNGSRPPGIASDQIRFTPKNKRKREVIEGRENACKT